MKTIRLIILCAATVSFILLVYSYRMEITGFIFRDYPPVRLQVYSAPNQQRLATVYFMRDHAESNFHCFLSMSTGGESFARTDRVITLLGSTAIECRWINDRLLLVKYFGFECTDDGPSLTQWHDVKIEYRKLTDPSETTKLSK